MVAKKYEKPTQHDGPRVPPRDLVGALLAVQVLEFKESLKTRYAPEGKPAVRVNVASVSSGKVAPDQLWMNGALVDALIPYVGDTTICKIEYATSASSGYRYLTIADVTDAEYEQGNSFLEKNPDLFTTAPTLEPEPETAGHW